jgi:Arc/MetJ family transcription regulator
LSKDPVMQTTVALDDDLLAKARALTGLKETSALIREALKALIECESARRLARLAAAARPIRPSRPAGGPSLSDPRRHLW